MERDLARVPVTRRKALLAGALAGAGALAAPSILRAQTRFKVKLAGTNLISSAPIYIARELNYFDAEGVDVEILESPSGNISVSSLLGGSADIAVTGYIIPFQLAEKGIRVQTICGVMMKSVYVFVARPAMDVKTNDPAALVAALKGKRFGVSNLSSAGDTVASGVLADFGAKSDDVLKVAVGVGGTALAALQSGAVDAMITYEPDLTRILAAGAGKVVLDLRSTRTEKSFSRIPSTALQATKAWIDEHPEAAAAVVRAVAKANLTLRNDVETSLKTMAKLYPNLSVVEIRSIYGGEHQGFYSKVSEADFDFARDMYLKIKAITNSVKYEEMTATRFSQFWT